MTVPPEQEDLAQQALHFGAQDYLVTELCDARSLQRAVRHAVERQRILADMRKIYKGNLIWGEDLMEFVVGGS